MSDVAHYIEREMSEIPGWLSATDARIFEWISHLQGQRGLTGDILEIGVYRGKSAVLLGHLLRGRERLVLCDLFDQPVSPSGAPPGPSAPADESPWYPGATLDGFLVTYGRYHAQPPVVYQCPSTELAAHENARGFRMIHIDGSHAYDNVRSDIALAATMLLPEGLVILDDYRSFHTPGVSAAVWEGVVNDGLLPLWLTQDKMYASWGLDVGELREPLQRMFHRTLGVEAVDEKVCGHDVLVALPKDYRGATHAREGRLLKALLPPVLATLPQRVRGRRAARMHAEP